MLGPLLGLVENQPSAGFGSIPLLVLLAVLPPLVAVAFVLSGRALTGAAVLTGVALLAPGRLLADLQLMHDVSRVSRPELLVQTSLADPSPAGGLWLLIAGHVVVAVAGVLAVGKAGAAPESAYATEVDGADDLVGLNRLDEPAGGDRAGGASAARGIGPRPIGWTLFFGMVAVAGLLMPPFSSDNAFLLAHGVVDGPLMALLGGLVIAAAVVVGCVYAGTSPRHEVTKGGVLGVFLAVAAVTAPNIASGGAVPGLASTLGPYLAFAALLVLAVVVFLLPSLRRANTATGAAPSDHVEVSLGSAGLHLATGVLGVLAGVAAMVGGYGSQLATAEGMPAVETFANRQLIPVAYLLVALGISLFTPLASATRPAFVVALGSVGLVGASSVDAILTVSDLSDAVHIGVGGWFTVAALVIAVAAAIFATIAGGAERDEVDLSDRTGAALNLPVAVPSWVAALLSVGAFGFPMIDAPDFVAPGIWSDFRVGSWGLLVAVVVVTAACLFAVGARPARAVALLLGAVVVVGVHLLELPLTGDRTAQAAPGLGMWLSLACVAALLLAAAMAVLTGRSRARNGS